MSLLYPNIKCHPKNRTKILTLMWQCSDPTRS